METGVIWKKIGETPLEALRRFRARHVIPEEIPLSYSGRLDPMAEGKILILVGDECKQAQRYRVLDKEYEVEILFGFSTDSGDVLGAISQQMPTQKIDRERVVAACMSLIGSHSWLYPHYSSRTVHGKPLFKWAQEKLIHTIEIPKTNTRIVSISVSSVRTIHGKDLLAKIQKKLEHIQHSDVRLTEVGGGFRVRDIAQGWERALIHSDHTYVIATIRCVAGSGTYMRTLAEKAGETIGVPALALSIVRTKIGKVQSFLGFTFWWPWW